jgi:hypothetical protein
MSRLSARLLIVLVCLLAPAASASAQQGDKAAVLATVNRLFDGMRMRDTTVMNSVWAPGARLVRVDKRSVPEAVAYNPASEFTGRVAAATGDAWTERIYDTEVQVDDGIAQVWAYYTFHLGDKFSHCGYDAFHLVKVNGEWRVTQVIDTSRNTGCRMTDPTP